MQSKYKLSDIKPIGNFDSVLEMFNEKLTKYEETKDTSRVSNFLKGLLVYLGVIEELKEGILEKDVWNIEEAKICLLYTHLLVIRANNMVQEKNNIQMAENHIQLMEGINGDSSYLDIFGELIL